MRTLNKLFLVLLAILTLQVVQAQADSTKVEVPKVHNAYLPEKGNFAIGADATPILDFVGNMFNGNLANSFSISSPLIYAKYYLTDNTALRMVVGVNNVTNSMLSYVADDAAKRTDPLSNAQVTDQKKDITNGYYVSLGLQKFIGEKRLRGFYGGQFFGQYNKLKAVYTYGNPMSSLNPIPSSTYLFGAERTLSEVTSHDFLIGVGGIAGFEYYVAPRLCIGGEVSLNVVYTQHLQEYKKTEKMVGNTLTSNDKAVSPGGHELSFQTLSFTPASFQHVGLYVMLHF